MIRISSILVRMVSTLGFFSLAACNGNFTRAPLCTQQNATTLPGLNGTYTVSLQSEKFDVHTFEINLETEEKDPSRVKVSMRSSSTAGPSDSEDAQLCHLGGRTLIQSPNRDGLGFEYVAVSVNAASITYQPVVFDRTQLDTDGIKYEIQESQSESALRKFSKNFDTNPLAMIISNENTPAQVVWKAARLLPTGLILNRK